jgi:hypothetical protein
MRVFVLAVACAVAGCASSAGGPAVATAPSGPQPLPFVTQLIAGEQMVWEVYWRGVLIGNASLDVDARRAHSKFATGILARALADVRYELTTKLDAQIAREASELVVLDGTTTRTELQLDGARYRMTREGTAISDDVPGGTALHTLHSALGALRAWAAPNASRAYLWLALRGKLYRLDATPPAAETLDGIRTLRVECVVRALDPTLEQVDVTLWLSTSPDHTPVRIVVETSGERIAAQLTETTATFATR